MKLKSIILASIILTVPSQVYAEVFDLVRTVSAALITIEDTKGGDFTQTGTMTILGNTVIRNSVYCSNNGSCLTKQDTSTINSVNNTSVVLFNPDSPPDPLSLFSDPIKSREKTLLILSTHPTVILLESELGGLEITEYKLRE